MFEELVNDDDVFLQYLIGSKLHRQKNIGTPLKGLVRAGSFTIMAYWASVKFNRDRTSSEATSLIKLAPNTLTASTLVND